MGQVFYFCFENHFLFNSNFYIYLSTGDNRPLVPTVATRGSPAASVTGQSSETPQSGSVHSMSYIEPDHGNDEVENVRRHKWACPCPKCGVQ